MEVEIWFLVGKGLLFIFWNGDIWFVDVWFIGGNNVKLCFVGIVFFFLIVLVKLK